MPILAAIPAVVGMGFAIDDALDTELGDNLGHESEESKARYAKAKGGVAGVHKDWQNLGNVADSSKQGVLDQRWNAGQSRGQQQGGLDMLQDYASGEKSASRLAAADAVDQNAQAMAAQAASGGAAAQRAAMYGTASGGQNIAGNVATAAAKEQLGAQSAYLTGAGQMRSGDAASMGAEQKYLQGNRNFALNQQGAKLNALNLGMSQEQENAKRSMAYDQAVRNSMAGQQQAETAERAQNIGMINNVVSTVGEAAGTGSDRSVKEGVAPAKPADIFGHAQAATSYGDGEDVFGSANNALMARDAEAAASAGMRNDPNWLDLTSQENQDVFSAGAYSQDEGKWDDAANQKMKDAEDIARRKKTLAAKQAAANAKATQVSEKQLQWEADNPQYEKVSTMTALNNLQGFNSKAIPGTWGNSTLNSVQQLVGSDEKVKEGVKGLSDEELSAEVSRRNDGDPVGAMLDSLEAKKYHYKEPNSRGAAPGEQIGVMAQDLEKTPAGAALVNQDGPDGTRMVDYAKSGPLAFAALAQLNDRLEKLEGNKRPDQGGQAYDPIAVDQTPYAPEVVNRPFEPDPVYLSQDSPGAEARYGGGMSPQGGPGAIQSALADVRQAADTSELRGQIGSDKLVKKGVSSLSDDELFSIIGNQEGATMELDKRMGVGPGAESTVKLRRPAPGNIEPDVDATTRAMMRGELPPGLAPPPGIPRLSAADVADEPSPSWTDRLAALYTGNEAHDRARNFAMDDKRWGFGLSNEDAAMMLRHKKAAGR